MNFDAIDYERSFVNKLNDEIEQYNKDLDESISKIYSLFETYKEHYGKNLNVENSILYEIMEEAEFVSDACHKISSNRVVVSKKEEQIKRMSLILKSEINK